MAHVQHAWQGCFASLAEEGSRVDHNVENSLEVATVDPVTVMCRRQRWRCVKPTEEVARLLTCVLRYLRGSEQLAVDGRLSLFTD